MPGPVVDGSLPAVPDGDGFPIPGPGPVPVYGSPPAVPVDGSLPAVPYGDGFPTPGPSQGRFAGLSSSSLPSISPTTTHFHTFTAFPFFALPFPSQ